VIRETDEGQEVILRLIEPGEIFGGAGGWGEATHPASARAQENAVVLQLPAESFSELMAHQPAFTFAVVHELGQRLGNAEARIRELQTKRVERRIARVLLRLANKTGRKTEKGIELGSPLPRQDLAELTGTTLSTASRTLSAWDQQGIVAAANAGRFFSRTSSSASPRTSPPAANNRDFAAAQRCSGLTCPILSAKLGHMDSVKRKSLTAEATVDESIKRYPPTAQVFIRRRMHCVGCDVERFHTVADTCRIYSLALMPFLAELRMAAGASESPWE
jgi:hybrid cluster-associated redox disulfide protein